MAKHDMWGTPIDFFNVVNEEFHFDLDAAATADDTLCARYITPEQDALVTPWEGKSVWCNPPYSMLLAFIGRGYEQHRTQKNTVCMLLPAYTDPKYWANFVMHAHEVRFLKGRLKFIDKEGSIDPATGDRVFANQTARYPSVLVVFKWIKGEHHGKGPNQWTWDWRVK